MLPTTPALSRYWSMDWLTMKIVAVQTRDSFPDRMILT